MLMQAVPIEPGSRARRFYVDAMRALDAAGMDYLVGGGYAMACYTGIARNTKDLDIFVRPADHKQILRTLERAGYRTEYFYPFWIAKALSGEDFIDVLYSSGNGQCRVDDDWFTNARPAEVLGHAVRLVPPEEQLWSKAFVMDRDRFDGADVAHLVLHCGKDFDWDRLLRRFKGHERVLLFQLLLFDYSFPSEREQVPQLVLQRLLEMAADRKAPADKVCYGTNISQKGFQADVRAGDFADGRLRPHGPLTPEELAQLPAE